MKTDYQFVDRPDSAVIKQQDAKILALRGVRRVSLALD